MSAQGKRILIVGGGFSGMAAAIQFRKMGADVDLVEIDPDWRSYGAGITISGAALRALGELGVLPDVVQHGAATDGVNLYTAAGMLLATMPTPRFASSDVPGNAGIMRPVLSKILAAATREHGTRVRLGVTFKTMRQDVDGVEVTFDDGASGVYDLVVGADGLSSQVRQIFFQTAPKPRYTGQGVWRAILPRPPRVKRLSMYMGPRTKVGLNPVSQDEMYMFVTEDRPANDRVNPSDYAALLGDLLAPFQAPLLQDIRANLGSESRIIYRPLEAMLLPQPWAVGRIVLIGDAVHATTPHLGAGAGLGIEDAVVLAEEINSTDSEASALERFQARRWERCRMVVENSARLGEIEATGGSQEEHTGIMLESVVALTMPI